MWTGTVRPARLTRLVRQHEALRRREVETAVVTLGDHDQTCGESRGKDTWSVHQPACCHEVSGRRIGLALTGRRARRARSETGV